MKHNRRWLLFLCLPLLFLVTGCPGDPAPKPNAQEAGEKKAKDRVNYINKNDVEGQNYNARQKLADQPATIIWCSVYPANPNVKPYTVPIVGKLTSGNKRPYPTSQGFDGGGDGAKSDGSDYHNVEKASPDGFFGTSGEYRYGFDPAGNYHDFYNMETYCTSVPNVIQKNTTQIAITVAGDLNSMDKKAQKALVSCRLKNADPSVSCPAAAQILGVEN